MSQYCFVLHDCFTMKGFLVLAESSNFGIFSFTRGPCPLLALLINPFLQGLRPLQPMLPKSHLFLAKIEQILIRFVYMRDQERKMRAANIYLGTFAMYRPKSRQMDLVMED